MTCDEIKNLSVLVAFGEGSAADGASVRDHARRCQACASEIAALTEGLELLKLAPRETPSRESRAAIGAMVLKESSRPARQTWRWGAAAAAAVLVAAVCWKVIPRGHEATPTPIPEPVAHQEKKPIRPTPVPVPAVDPATAWDSSDDLESLRTAVADLRTGGSSATTTKSVAVDPYFDSGSSASFDSFYDDLDALTNSGADKF